MKTLNLNSTLLKSAVAGLLLVPFFMSCDSDNDPGVSDPGAPVFTTLQNAVVEENS